MERPKIGVATLIKKDGKIAFLKRHNSHGENTWGLPGGHLEFNETLEECAAREIKEEIGINITNIKFGALTNDIFEKEQKHYITIFMTADYESGDAKVLEPEKSKELNWFRWNELPEPLFLPVQNLLKQNFNPFD